MVDGSDSWRSLKSCCCETFLLILESSCCDVVAKVLVVGFVAVLRYGFGLDMGMLFSRHYCSKRVSHTFAALLVGGCRSPMVALIYSGFKLAVNQISSTHQGLSSLVS